jgi:hypothetical protein
MLPPEDLEAILEENEALLLYPPEDFEHCLIGYVRRFTHTVALYDEEKVIEVFMRRDGATYTNAREHFEFNVIGGWSGDGTPAFATLLDPVG